VVKQVSRNLPYWWGHARAGSLAPARLCCLYDHFLVGKGNKFPPHLSILREPCVAGKGDRTREDSQKIGGVVGATVVSSPSLRAAARNTERGRERDSLRRGETVPASRARGAGPPGHHLPTFASASCCHCRDRNDSQKSNKNKKGHVSKAQK